MGESDACLQVEADHDPDRIASPAVVEGYASVIQTATQCTVVGESQGGVKTGLVLTRRCNQTQLQKHTNFAFDKFGQSPGLDMVTEVQRQS